MNNLQNKTSQRTYKTETEASARLRELEAKYDLFKYTIDGYSAWRLLRSGVTRSLQTLPFQKQIVSSKWFRLGKVLLQSIVDLPAVLFPQTARCVVKTCSSALNEKDGDCWKDIYFDDLLTEIGHCYKIEVQNNPAFFHRRKAAMIPVTITASPIHLLAAIFKKVFRRKENSEIARIITAVLRDEPDLHFLNSHTIADRLNYFYWSKKIYKWLLMRIRPDFLLFEDTESFEICAAAKELGITAAEFQHGIFSRNHPDALPSLALPYKSTLIVPDKLFLYGNFWRRELESGGFYDQELCVVGSARIDRYRKVRTAYKAKNRHDATCYILLTTQGFAVDQLIGFIVQFINLAENQLNYQLYIKLHPIYDRDRSIYDTGFSSNKRIEVFSGDSDPSTFDLLARADLHVSISSACHYDALGLGVPTVILALPNHEIVLHLVDSNHANLAQTPTDLMDIAMKWQDISVLPEVSEFYFQPNALVNIKRELGVLEIGYH